jgi:MFS family permease
MISAGGGMIRRLRSRVRDSAWRFSKDYWLFFTAAFFFDLGFDLYLFLFNLYLTDLHFNERLIGQITAALTLGNVAGTIPATMLVRRHGIKPLLLFSFLAAPLISVFRLFVLHQPAQLALAFATGAALCPWPICFSPAVASITDERNRTTGFSIVFATGIGMGTLAGVLGGYLPGLLEGSRLQVPLIGGLRIVLLLACAIVAAGAWPLARLALPREQHQPGGRLRIFHPYLRRFLPPFLLWSIVTGSFPAFGAIYLQRIMKLPLSMVGMVFAGSQLMQFAAILLAPFLFRRASLARGIAIAQFATAAFLVLLTGGSSLSFAIAFYLAYNGAMFMCEPGMYNLLMNRIPPEERSTASALQNLSSALCQAGTAAVTGSCIVLFGYHPVILANAACALVASVLFFALARGADGSESSQDPAAAAGGRAAQCSHS